jgi:hypothetical protein
MSKVRVVRVIEYIGDESWIKRTLDKSIHGLLNCGNWNQIKTIIGSYPTEAFNDVIDLGRGTSTEEIFKEVDQEGKR